jgi:hypothetical protein
MALFRANSGSSHAIGLFSKDFPTASNTSGRGSGGQALSVAAFFQVLILR